MTDRHAAYLVVLDRDIREDDSQEIIRAIQMIKFVSSVKPVVAYHDLQIAEIRRDRQWADALHRLAQEGPEERV